MMRRTLAFVALLSLGTLANASTTICKASGGPGSIRSIVWDTQSQIAKVSYSEREQVSGRLTLIRPHDKGVKVNIVVQHEKPRYGVDVTELVVFNISDRNHYRLLMVNYVLVAGIRHVTSSMPSEEVDCETL